MKGDKGIHEMIPLYNINYSFLFKFFKKIVKFGWIIFMDLGDEDEEEGKR